MKNNSYIFCICSEKQFFRINIKLYTLKLQKIHYKPASMPKDPKYTKICTIKLHTVGAIVMIQIYD